MDVGEIKKIIDEDVHSAKKQSAGEGQRYYEGRHDILKYKIYYVDSDGKMQEDKLRSNIKISHPFFTELVDQQVQYMMSGAENIFRSDDEGLQVQLDEYFNDDFYNEVYELLTGTVSKGFDYMYAYKDEDGKTCFQYADSLGVVEVRERDIDEKCKYIIYHYADRIEKNKETIRRIQVWDDNQVTFYVQKNNGAVELDKDAGINPRPHIIIHGNGNQKGQLYGKSLGYIPFFRLDNGRKGFSGLKPIKALIDDYDLMACSLSNNLQDFTDAIYVVSGFQGQNLDEFMQNVKAKKHVGVSENGSLDIKTVDIPYQARQTKLELDEKNIYRFGMGFNSAQIGDGNITNIVIKSRYALLDLKCNKLEIRLKQFFRRLLKIVLDEINQENGTDYRMKDVYFKFEREVMTNAQDNAQIELMDAQTQGQLLNNIMDVAAKLDNETVIRSICDILDIDYEEVKKNISSGDSLKNAQQALGGLIPEGDSNDE